MEVLCQEFYVIWGKYRVSVEEVEPQTGYNLLSNVAKGVERPLKAVID